ncbi:hypothetical protein N7520_010903 [Penicillium odoratum]|uniref:uncharacterized protein n=1 Tax=Penicillium odoratum TaxID=1167516 RepID=UPI00254805A4|nr:uncharacterized protein N7520_010903 [Penicillium odoratum]KAJ5745721.1 hypothetical protein N7520_010903 [Penicillium odoratum]
MPYDIATNASVLILRAVSRQTFAEIAASPGISQSQVNQIYAKAIERGFQENQRPIRIKDAYVSDAPRSEQPKKESTMNQDVIISKCVCDRNIGNNKSADLKKSWISEDEANSEAWITEDES